MGDCVCGGSAQAARRALVPARKEYETCSSLFCPNDPSFPDFADNEPRSGLREGGGFYQRIPCDVRIL